MCLKEIVIKKQSFMYKDLYGSDKISFLWIITTSWDLLLMSCQYDTNSTITDPPIAKTPPISEDYRGGGIMPSMSFQDFS